MSVINPQEIEEEASSVCNDDLKMSPLERYSPSIPFTPNTELRYYCSRPSPYFLTRLLSRKRQRGRASRRSRARKMEFT